MPKLTKRIVDAAKPDAEGRRVYLWDTDIKGYALQVLPTGVMSYVYQYRTPEGRSRRATIAKVGTLTPDQARAKAESLARVVKDGGDPLDAKAKALDALTLNDIFDLYLAGARFAEKADTTRPIDEGRIRRHLRPLLGKTYAHKLTVEDVRRAHAAIRSGKTAVDSKTAKDITPKKRGRVRVTGGDTTGRDCIALLRAILNWAVEEKLADENPAASIKLGSSGVREIFLDEPEHYARLFTTLDTMEAEKRIRPAVADAIRVIALTGARKSEVTRCRWRFVDLKAGTITLPPASHKTGRRTGKPRVIMLPAVAQQIIARQAEGGPDDFVFAPAKGDGGEVDIKRPWLKVRAEARLPAGIGLHGLRHSIASLMALDGAEAAQIMAALGHRQLSTAQRYIHFAQNARAALAERAAGPAMAGMAAAAGKPRADVATLPDGKRRAS